jgi:branched-chain amino acid transport system substrate-binding protein
MQQKQWLALWLMILLPLPTTATEQLKIGFITTLSGPSPALGIDTRDGFNLALKHTDGKLGGVATEVIIGDDQMNPDTGKQLADRMVKRDKVQLVTGIVFSNVLMAVINPILKSETFYVSSNASPSALAGEQCSAYFFSVSWPNEAQHEAMGKHMTDKNFKNAYILAPNYPAGKDALAGFKRFYKGNVSAEVYTKLGQLDYAAELAQLRAAKPDAVYIFLPGAVGRGKSRSLAPILRSLIFISACTIATLAVRPCHEAIGMRLYAHITPRAPSRAAFGEVFG